MKQHIEDLNKKIAPFISIPPAEPNDDIFNEYFSKIHQYYGESDAPKGVLLEQRHNVTDALLRLYVINKSRNTISNDPNYVSKQTLCITALHTVLTKSEKLGATIVDDLPIGFSFALLDKNIKELTALSEAKSSAGSSARPIFNITKANKTMKQEIINLTKGMAQYTQDKHPVPANIHAFNSYFAKVQQYYNADNTRDDALGETVAGTLAKLLMISKRNNLFAQQSLCFDTYHIVATKLKQLGADTLLGRPIQETLDVLDANKDVLIEISDKAKQQKDNAGQPSSAAASSSPSIRFTYQGAPIGSYQGSFPLGLIGPHLFPMMDLGQPFAAFQAEPHLQENANVTTREITDLTKYMQPFIGEKPTPPNAAAFDNYFRKAEQYYNTASRKDLLESRDEVAVTLDRLFAISEKNKFFVSQHLCLKAYDTGAQRSLILAMPSLVNITPNEIDKKRERLAQVSAQEESSYPMVNLTNRMRPYAEGRTPPNLGAYNNYFKEIQQYYNTNDPSTESLLLDQKDVVIKTLTRLYTISKQNKLIPQWRSSLDAMQAVIDKSYHLGATTLASFPIEAVSTTVAIGRSELAELARQEDLQKKAQHEKELADRKKAQQDEKLAEMQFKALMAEEAAAEKAAKAKAKAKSGAEAKTVTKTAEAKAKQKQAPSPALASSAPVVTTKTQTITKEELDQFTPVTKKPKQAASSAASAPTAKSFAQRVPAPMKPQMRSLQPPKAAAAFVAPQQPPVSQYKGALLGQRPTTGWKINLPLVTAQATVKPQATFVAAAPLPITRAEVKIPTPKTATPRAASPVRAEQPAIQAVAPLGDIANSPLESAAPASRPVTRRAASPVAVDSPVPPQIPHGNADVPFSEATSAPSKPATPRAASPANATPEQAAAPQGEISNPPSAATEAASSPAPRAASPVLADSPSTQPQAPQDAPRSATPQQQPAFEDAPQAAIPQFQQYAPQDVQQFYDPNQAQQHYTQQAYYAANQPQYPLQGYYPPMQPQELYYQEPYPPYLPPAPPGYAYVPVPQPDPVQMAWQIGYQQQQQIGYQQQQMAQMQQQLSWQQQELQRVQQQISAPRSFAANESARRENGGQKQRGGK